MTLPQAILLGIVQGLTEFLPVSSTAHLRIVPALAGFADPGAGYTAILQLGTLAAVLWYFWTDITQLLRAWMAGILRGLPFGTPLARQGWLIIAATLPIIACGLLLKPWIKEDLATGTVPLLRTLTAVAIQLLAGSALLAAAEAYAAWRAKRGLPGKETGQLGARETLGMGLFQCLALLPGMSRSGSTISGGLLLGLTRETAARFSFLLSLPAITAAAFYAAYDDVLKPLVKNEETAAWLSGDHRWQLPIATVVSGLVGYAAIAFLLNYLKRHGTQIFIIYRVLLAVALLVSLHYEWLQNK